MIAAGFAVVVALAVHVPAAAPSPSALPSASLYRIEGRFTDAVGGVVGLDVARGHPVLLAMFYASCPRACPLLISDVKRVLQALPDVDRAAVSVVLVSLDPARDTPAVLAQTLRARSLDPQHWTLLRADPSTTRVVAAALGVRWRDNGDGSIDHTSRIVLLDGAGVPVATRNEIGGPVEDFVAALQHQTALSR